MDLVIQVEPEQMLVVAEVEALVPQDNIVHKVPLVV